MITENRIAETGGQKRKADTGAKCSRVGLSGIRYPISGIEWAAQRAELRIAVSSSDVSGRGLAFMLLA